MRNKRRRYIKRRNRNNFIINIFALAIILFLSMILLSTSVTYFSIMFRFLIKALLYFVGFAGCIFLIYWFFKTIGL